MSEGERTARTAKGTEHLKPSSLSLTPSLCPLTFHRSVERDTLAAALAQQAADGEPSATMAAMAGIAAVESGIESAKTAARLAASNTNNNNGGAVPILPPAHSREMAVKAAGVASAAGDANWNGAGNGNAELSPTSHTLRAMAALQAKKGKVSV